MALCFKVEFFVSVLFLFFIFIFLPLLKGLEKTDLPFSLLAPVHGPCTGAAGRRPEPQELAWGRI